MCAPPTPPGDEGCERYTSSWKVGAWGACAATCGASQRTRSVVCRRCDGRTSSSCSGGKPAGSEGCTVWTYRYEAGGWGTCSNACGVGSKKRSVVCKRCDGASVSASHCTAAPPSGSDRCESYTYSWSAGAWGPCTMGPVCGKGVQTRTVYCRRCDGKAVSESHCSGSVARSQGCTAYTYSIARDAVQGTCEASTIQCGSGSRELKWHCRRCDGAVGKAEVDCKHLPLPWGVRESCVAHTYKWVRTSQSPCTSVCMQSGERTNYYTCMRCDGLVAHGKCPSPLPGPVVEKCVNGYTYKWGPRTRCTA
eukprot:Sspe_Gene.20370::Locus_7466_Transcript_1_1_Confidence_1.000_Length_2977::g.20370::m.20370